MKSKASLYKRSDPHKAPAVTDSGSGHLRQFRCELQHDHGGRYVMVRATVLSEAISKALHQCSNNEIVVGVEVNGKKIWDCYNQ